MSHAGDPRAVTACHETAAGQASQVSGDSCPSRTGVPVGNVSPAPNERGLHHALAGRMPSFGGLTLSAGPIGSLTVVARCRVARPTPVLSERALLYRR